ncbi:MAG TPA: hypothetical protein VNA20_07225 [Frankiaceae bacterium]|nr:hypothetical protein [Frankiaceae bacterium]
MRTVRLALSAALLAAVVAPAAASADGRCKPYFYDEQVGPVTVTRVDIVC